MTGASGNRCSRGAAVVVGFTIGDDVSLANPGGTESDETGTYAGGGIRTGDGMGLSMALLVGLGDEQKYSGRKGPSGDSRNGVE